MRQALISLPILLAFTANASGQSNAVELSADIRLGAARIDEALGDDWKVRAQVGQVVIEWAGPVAFAYEPINAPALAEDEAEKLSISDTKVCRYTLRFSGKVTLHQYEKLRAENRATERKHDALRARVRHITHKYDSYLPANDKERKQLAEFRRDSAKLKYHDLPDLFTLDHSVWLYRSWRHGEFPADKMLAASADDLEQTLLRLFGVYHPSVARAGMGLAAISTLRRSPLDSRRQNGRSPRFRQTRKP